MQTSQVNNPANMFSTTAPVKQADANNANESFGQVLSREVADRGNVEPTKGKDAVANPPRQQQVNAKPVKSAETKAPGDARSGAHSNVKSGDDAKASKEVDETETAVSQVSDDMLALVANLNQFSVSATEAAEAAKVTSVDAAQMLAAAGLVRNSPTVAISDDPATLAESDLGMASIASPTDAAKPASDLRVEIGQTSVAATDFAAKGRELLNIAPEGSDGKEFSALLKNSLTETAAPVTQMVQSVAMQGLQTQVASAIHASEKLTPAVGTPAWDQALGQKVVWMVAGEQQSASLTLNPPDLGPLQVVLSVNNSQASATFTAAQPEVRQALEAAMPKLRDMLGEAGIQLGQATVNSGSPNQQGAQDQHASQSRRASGRDTSRGDEASRIGRVVPSSSGNGLVDTFA